MQTHLNKISPPRVRPDHLDSQGLWATREKRSEQSYTWLQKSFNGTFCLTELLLHVPSIQGELGLPGPAGVDGEQVEIQSKWHTGRFNVFDLYEVLCSLCEGAKGGYGWKRSPRRERREGRDGAVWALCKSWSMSATCLSVQQIKSIIKSHSMLYLGQGMDGLKGEKGECRIDDNLVSILPAYSPVYFWFVTTPMYCKSLVKLSCDTF